MQFEQPTGMYVATGILFLLPCSLLFFAWTSLIRAGTILTLPWWRRRLVNAALLTAVFATLLHIVWNISWLHSGGSPHGMGAAPGIWEPLGPVLVTTFVAAAVLSLFGKGKGRLLLVGWTFSMYFVFEAVYILQFD